jgi:hypothetical protein
MAAGRLADLGHGIAGFRVDRDRAQLARQLELRGIEVDGVDGAGAKRPCELHGGNAESADAEHRDGIAAADARLAERMQGGRRGTHHDGALLERDFRRQRVCIARGHADELREAAVAVLADHLPGRAELLAPRAALAAGATGDEIMQAHPIALARRGDAEADSGDDTRDLVTERQRMARRADARAVVRIGVADACRHHAYHDLAGGG